MKNVFVKAVRVAALPLFIMAAVAVPAHATPVTEGPNLFQNGSFETGDLTGYQVFNPNNVGVSDGDPSDGDYKLAFNSGETSPVGSISQTIPTVIGKKYVVAFDYAIFGYESATQSINVGFTGNPSQKATAISVYQYLGVEYSSFSFEFTATQTSSTVSFSDDSNNNGSSSDGYLDNIRVYGKNAPTAISLSNNKVKEGLPIGSFVGQLATTDPDAGDSFTYSLVSGDTANFDIDGRYLRTNSSFDADLQGSYNVTIRSTDSTGLTFDQAFTIFVQETTKPVVAITSPTSGQKVLLANLTGSSIAGTASDNRSVAEVRVRLARKRGTANQYWNGTDFVAAQSTVAAELSSTIDSVGVLSPAPGITWILGANTPPAGKLDNGAYSIQVFAVDAAGNKSDYAERSFTISADFTAPTVGITAPTSGQKVTSAAFAAGAAQGNAADAEGVTAVKVRLSRKVGTTTYYWNGSDFVTGSAVVDADVTGTTSATWTLGTKAPSAGELTAGTYNLAVYSLDAAGNKSATANTSFTINSDFVAPSVAITSPTSSQLVKINEFGEGTISGTASDNLYVSSVKVKLQRKRGTETQYWNGTTFTNTVALVDAVYDGEYGTWSLSGIPASELDKGAYTVYATAYDAAGNKTTSPSRIFYISVPASPSATAAADSSAGNS